MKTMVEISTYDGQTYQISESRAAVVNQAMAAGDSHVLLDGIATLAIRNISRMETVELPDDLGAAELELPASVDLGEIQPKNDLQARWLRLLAINAHRIANRRHPHEKVALLRTIDDLDRLEAIDGFASAILETQVLVLALSLAEMAPDDVVEYAPASEWRTSEQADSVRAIWVKRRISQRDYHRYHAGHPGYYKLRDDGDDRVLVGFRFVTELKALPRHLEACDPSECKRLEWLAGRR